MGQALGQAAVPACPCSPPRDGAPLSFFKLTAHCGEHEVLSSSLKRGGTSHVRLPPTPLGVSQGLEPLARDQQGGVKRLATVPG